MSDGPSNIPLLDYAINLGIALAGAAVRFVREWRTNFTEWQPSRVFIEGLFSALTAGFAGILTMWVLRSWKTDPYYTAFAVGIMGHMGPEGIALLTDLLKNGFRSRSETPSPPEK